MAKIGKRTLKITKEQKAKLIFDTLTAEQKEILYLLIGMIACGEVKNYYATGMYKSISKDFTNDQRAVVTYICKKVGIVKAFENMEELTLSIEG